MKSTLIRPRLRAKYRVHRKALRILVLVVGIGAFGSALAVRIAEPDWSPLSIGLTIVMGVFEALWLLMAPGGTIGRPRRGMRLRHHYAVAVVVFIALVCLLPLWSPATRPGDSASDGHGPQVSVVLFFASVFVAAVYFGIELWRALVAVPEGTVLIGRPMGEANGRLRFSVWYAWAGAIVYGFSTGSLLGSGMRPAAVLTIVSGVSIVVICVVLVHRWPVLGGATRDATKFLLRQAALSVLFSFAVMIGAVGFDSGLQTTILGAATTTLLVNAAEVLLLAHRHRVQNAARTESPSLPVTTPFVPPSVP